MKSIFIISFLCLLNIQVYSQAVFEPITSGVYDFIDELSALKIIEINSAVKPYTRKKIAQLFSKIDTSELNRRQQKELEFYMLDFNKELHPDKDFNKRIDLFYYADSLFKITLNPIGGIRYYTNSNGNIVHRWNGAETYGSLGKHFGFSASLRDNGISQALSTPDQLTQFQGGNFKYNQGVDMQRTDFNEMKGGISWSWQWGSISLLKDHFTWGNNYNGANIFSAHQPSFAFIQLKLNPTSWLDFNYIHGWLVSQIVDSTRSYFIGGQRRRVFHDKYLASNMFTITPFKNFNFSFGNSIIYGDIGEHPAYLIPFFFYKSIDHTYNGTGGNDIGQNSQLFFDISSRQIKHLHIYSTLFIDEVRIGKIFSESQHTNLFSWKAGLRLFDFPVNNVWLTAEYTRTNPWTYTHNIAVTTFESNNYNLGHYLRDNADEVFLELSWLPMKNLRCNLSWAKARKGPEMIYEEINGINNIPGSTFMEHVRWWDKYLAVKISWEAINDGTLYLELRSEQNSGLIDLYSPALFRGSTLTLITGINFGF